jgi:light-regulated signal transduction histidine kinase (bacteriophytochrome)
MTPPNSNPNAGAAPATSPASKATQEHSAEASLRRRAEQLAGADRQFQALIYTISHDLRAPVRAIDGFSAALEEESAAVLSEHSRHYLARIRAAAKTLDGMIEDLLQLSRVRSSQMQLQPLDLSLIAQNVSDELKTNCGGREVDILIEPGLRAVGDRRLASMMLRHLLDNALKFTAPRKRAIVSFGAQVCADGNEFFLRDNGVGCDPLYIDRLFSPFQRLHAPGEFPGRGIGLAVVARIVHRHEGSVRLESVLGEGTTVCFRLD